MLNVRSNRLNHAGGWGDLGSHYSRRVVAFLFGETMEDRKKCVECSKPIPKYRDNAGYTDKLCSMCLEKHMGKLFVDMPTTSKAKGYRLTRRGRKNEHTSRGS